MFCRLEALKVLHFLRGWCSIQERVFLKAFLVHRMLVNTTSPFDPSDVSHVTGLRMSSL
jgi:hypothetical protein